LCKIRVRRVYRRKTATTVRKSQFKSLATFRASDKTVRLLLGVELERAGDDLENTYLEHPVELPVQFFKLFNNFDRNVSL